MQTTAAQIAEITGGRIRGEGDVLVDDVADVDHAEERSVTFIAGERNVDRLVDCKAGVVLITHKAFERAGDKTGGVKTFVLVDDPREAFIQLVDHFRPPRPRARIGISSRATVSPTARIGAYTNIHPGAHVDDEAAVGSQCEIHAGVVVGRGCRIGNRTTLHSGVVLYDDVCIGDDVVIHANSVIGSDGFGYRMIDGRHVRIPHRGTVRIENDVEIGACTTIDRAFVGETVIGEGTRLDNLVQIAHNVHIGRHNAFAAQVGVAGSSTTGAYVVAAGQSGIADHTTVGDNCTLASNAAVVGVMPAGETWSGIPGRPIAHQKRVWAAQQRLPEMRTTLRELKATVKKLEQAIDANSVEPAARDAA